MTRPVMSHPIRRSAMLACALFIACGPNRPRTIAPLPEAMMEPWTTQPGDQIRINVWREPELTGEVFVQNDGTAIIPALGRLKVAGLTADSLNSLLVAMYRTRIVGTPVDARLIRPLPVFGSVRSPGVYPVDPTSTTIQLIARAGGTVGAEGVPRVKLLRYDGTEVELTVEQSLGALNIRSGDAIFVQDQSWWIRNQRQVTTVAAVSTIIASVVSIIFLIGQQ